MTQYTHTVIQDATNPGWHEDFVYDEIGMVYIKDIHDTPTACTDMRFLSKMDQDYYYDLLKGDYLGSGSTFPATKKWGDRYLKSGVYYWWDGTDWILFGVTYYLMLDYFPTKTSYLETGSRVYRTDEDKEYRYNGSAWVEITTTSGDAKKRIQSKDGMTTITADDESSCFHCREIDAADPINDAYTKFWAVVPVGGVFPDRMDMQLYFAAYRWTQRYLIPEYTGWKIDWARFWLQSQELVKPVADIINAPMAIMDGDTWAYYDVTNFAGGLYYRKFSVKYYKGDINNPDEVQYWESEHTGIPCRTTCDEWDPYLMCAAYTTLRYVDGATGSDSNGGTSWDDAWATIGKAASTVTAGTLVTVKAGTYNITSSITPANSGTAYSLIHYHADGEVIIDGVSGIELIYLQKDYTIIEGFEIRNGFIGILIEGSQHNIIYNNYIHDIGPRLPGAPSTAGIHIVNYASPYDDYHYIIGNKIEDVEDASAPDRAFCIMNVCSNWNAFIYNELVADAANGETIFYSANSGDENKFYSYDGTNSTGNFWSDAIDDDSNNDCIGSSYTKNGFTDFCPIVRKGAAYHKAHSIRWLRNHLSYSLYDIVSYVRAQNMHQLGLVNVPPTGSGGVPPNSFVKSWCPDTKTRRVAYSKPFAGGASIGGCDIRGCGQMIDGCSVARIQTINPLGTTTYNPISRILDRNKNGDIVISGTGLFDLEG